MVRCLLVSLLILAAVSYCRCADITLSAEPTEIRPGDLATVTARMTSTTYETMTVGLQPNPLLRLISREPGNVQKTADGYVQEHRWILQAVASGTVEWKNLQATVSNAEGDRSVDLRPLSLTIDPFEEPGGGTAPLPLPDEQDNRQFPTLFVFIGIGMILLVSIVVLAILRKSKGGEG